MKLDKYDVALINAACKEDSRPMLQNLHLTKGRIEVADGFVLLIRELELEEGEDKPEALLPARMVKQIKTGRKQQAVLKTDNKEAKVTYQDEEGKPIDFEPTYSFRAYGDGKSYPNTDAIISPITTEKKAHIAVSVGLLKKLLTTMPNEGILRLGITEPTEPLEFVCGNMDRPIRGLLMPMFVQWDKAEWQRANEEVKEESNARD